METIPTICPMSSEEDKALNQLDLDKSSEINLLIGPELGLEIEELADIDCSKIHLGPRTLRADTAAISAVGILQFLYGDMGNT